MLERTIMFSFIHKNCRFVLSWPRGFAHRDAEPCLGIAARFIRDRSGAYAVMFGLMAPIFIGALALGSETGVWYAAHEKMQGAADSSAISAAIGLIDGDTNVTLEADATAASNGYLNGSSGTVVTVNKPPQSGPNKGNAGAVEVIIKQPQPLTFSSLFLKSPVVVQARAVAGPNPQVVCVLAKSKILPLVPGITTVLSNVLADQCTIADNSNSPLALTVAALATMTAAKIDVVGGVVDVLATVTPTPITGAPATADPFAGTTVPPIASLPCDLHSAQFMLISGTVALSPGRYCGGLTVSGTGNVTLSPGTYYMDGGLLGGTFSVLLGGKVTGTGVTIVLTANNPLVGLPTLALGGVINLTAPTTGPYANLVLFVDPGALLSALLFVGPQTNFIGTIYAPSSIVTYALGSSTTPAPCTRLIADTIAFAAGSSGFSKCAVTLGPSSAAPASLLE
jgi:Putative Flp pilus-assembly TadE/G-like